MLTRFQRASRAERLRLVTRSGARYVVCRRRRLPARCRSPRYEASNSWRLYDLDTGGVTSVHRADRALGRSLLGGSRDSFRAVVRSARRRADQAGGHLHRAATGAPATPRPRSSRRMIARESVRSGLRRMDIWLLDSYDTHRRSRSTADRADDASERDSSTPSTSTPRAHHVPLCARAADRRRRELSPGLGALALALSWLIDASPRATRAEGPSLRDRRDIRALGSATSRCSRRPACSPHGVYAILDLFRPIPSLSYVPGPARSSSRRVHLGYVATLRRARRTSVGPHDRRQLSPLDARRAQSTTDPR